VASGRRRPRGGGQATVGRVQRARLQAARVSPPPVTATTAVADRYRPAHPAPPRGTRLRDRIGLRDRVSSRRRDAAPRRHAFVPRPAESTPPGWPAARFHAWLGGSAPLEPSQSKPLTGTGDPMTVPVMRQKAHSVDQASPSGRSSWRCGVKLIRRPHRRPRGVPRHRESSWPPSWAPRCWPAPPGDPPQHVGIYSGARARARASEGQPPRTDEDRPRQARPAGYLSVGGSIAALDSQHGTWSSSSTATSRPSGRRAERCPRS
jgi:hypothetical protein